MTNPVYWRLYTSLSFHGFAALKYFLMVYGIFWRLQAVHCPLLTQAPTLPKPYANYVDAVTSLPGGAQTCFVPSQKYIYNLQDRWRVAAINCYGWFFLIGICELIDSVLDPQVLKNMRLKAMHDFHS